MSQNDSLKIVVLYAEVVGYVISLFKALKKCNRQVEIDVVYWDKKHINSSKLLINEVEQVQFHPRTKYDDNDLLKLLRIRSPDIVFVSGWMDKGYLKAIRKYRSTGGVTQVVCGMDDQWKNKVRQHVGRFYFRFFYSKLFDFMWVAGKPQYHYAQRLGYEHERIITNLYSAEDGFFNKRSKFSKRFVYIGRFDPVKALDQLLEAYSNLPEKTKNEWPLILIGDGQLKATIEQMKSKHIIVKPFLQPQELIIELLKGGVSCITSHSEQWGVAIHEMAILGYPLVLSSACGAATEFLISGYNGFLYRRSNKNSLYQALVKITTLDDEELETFSQRSHSLGLRITPEQNAYSLLSVIELAPL
jgi:glycosyltransferase involved in cell wall biosynthesis